MDELRYSGCSGYSVCLHGDVSLFVAEAMGSSAFLRACVTALGINDMGNWELARVRLRSTLLQSSFPESPSNYPIFEASGPKYHY